MLGYSQSTVRLPLASNFLLPASDCKPCCVNRKWGLLRIHSSGRWAAFTKLEKPEARGRARTWRLAWEPGLKPYLLPWNSEVVPSLLCAICKHCVTQAQQSLEHTVRGVACCPEDAFPGLPYCCPQLTSPGLGADHMRQQGTASDATSQTQAGADPDRFKVEW